MTSRFSLAAGTSLVVFMATFALSCSDDDKESGPPSYVGATTSGLVTAAEGGKLAVGAVSVDIPKDAIETDQSITITVAAKQDFAGAASGAKESVAIDVYKFAPDTTFKQPVKMAFDLKGVSTNNKRADIAFLDRTKNAWEKLTDSKVVGGKVEATTTHFSEFTVILTDSGGSTGGPGPGFALACENTGFQACGGDIAGTWSFQTACSNYVFEDGASTFPCAEPDHYESELTVTGTLAFGTDGSYQIDQTITLMQKQIVPLSCLAEISSATGQPFTCDMLPNGVIEGDNCVSNYGADETPTSLNETGMYTADGSMLSYTTLTGEELDSGIYGDAGSLFFARGEFCVEGNMLRVRYQEDSSIQGLVREFTAVRVE